MPCSNRRLRCGDRQIPCGSGLTRCEHPADCVQQSSSALLQSSAAMLQSSAALRRSSAALQQSSVASAALICSAAALIGGAAPLVGGRHHYGLVGCSAAIVEHAALAVHRAADADPQGSSARPTPGTWQHLGGRASISYLYTADNPAFVGKSPQRASRQLSPTKPGISAVYR
jgi:hypothetical protein